MCVLTAKRGLTIGACILSLVAVAPAAAANMMHAQGQGHAEANQPIHELGEAEALPTPSRSRPEELDCGHNNLRRINEAAVPAEFAKVKKPIEFSVHETNPVVSFGASRGTEADYIVLQASRPIPLGILSKNFEVDTREPMKRIGTTSLESVHLRAPFYTRPHFFNHRREIGFNFCVAGAGADPGTYTGQFVFVGPDKIVSTVFTQTAQLKATHNMFWLIAVAVLLAMAVALITRTFLEHPGRLWKHEFWSAMLPIPFLIGAALVAMLLAYSEAPTWGENLVFAISALVATAFTAAGLGNTLTTAVSGIRSRADAKSHGHGSSAPQHANSDAATAKATPQRKSPGA